MSLMDQIKQDQLEARKRYMEVKSAVLGRPSEEPPQSSKSALLTTLLGEASIIGKNAGRETTDDEVVAVVKKFIKNIDECLAVEKDTMKIIALNLEKAHLSAYLPVQLDTDQMFEIIKKLRTDKGAKLEMKDIMGAFKSQFNGMYDGRILSGVAQTYLSSQV